MAHYVWHHIKVTHISVRYGTYLNLDEEIITRAPIVDRNSNLKLNQESLDSIYHDYQCDTFKIKNSFVHQILSKKFMDTDAYVYMNRGRV